MIMHCSCIHTFLFLFLVLFLIGTFLFVSLSPPLSQTVCAWHLRANLLYPRTLFVPRHHLLILLLFLSSSVMRRLIRTSWRTFPDVAFIQNATWFYHIFSILLYPLSFTVRDGNLYVRYSWATPSWSYRSSTPICMVSIPLYLTGSRYAYRSHTGAYLWCTTRSEGGTLVVLIYNLCPKTNSLLSFVRHLLHGVIVKTFHTRALQKVQGSLTWWWHSFFILCLTITRLPSLVLAFCFPSLRILPLTSLAHFFLSLIDVYRDTATCDKLIFPSAITRIIRHSSIPYPEYVHFTIIGAISIMSVWWSEA